VTYFSARIAQWMLDPMEIFHKNQGETPLEALLRFRGIHPELEKVPLTYAGRLDPMAEGELLVLIGDECKQKEKYLSLDKEYEIEVLLGLETDTNDALGLVSKISDKELLAKTNLLRDFQPTKYIGKFLQEYPAFSSKTVNGVQLHQLARQDELPEEMPTKEVEIYEIEKMGEGVIGSTQLLAKILDSIDLVKGDFRQNGIKEKWKNVLQNPQLSEEKTLFPIISLMVRCSSGTYMRSLANRIGKDLGVGGIALSIRRTRIFLIRENDLRQ